MCICGSCPGGTPTFLIRGNIIIIISSIGTVTQREPLSFRDVYCSIIYIKLKKNRYTRKHASSIISILILQRDSVTTFSRNVLFSPRYSIAKFENLVCGPGFRSRPVLGQLRLLVKESISLEFVKLTANCLKYVLTHVHCTSTYRS